jgi:hypothetical protein
MTPRRDNWLDREWRTSRSGNEYVNVEGYNITIFKKGDAWNYRIAEDGGQPAFGDPCASSDEAKMAAFNALFPASEAPAEKRDDLPLEHLKSLDLSPSDKVMLALGMTIGTKAEREKTIAYVRSLPR